MVQLFIETVQRFPVGKPGGLSAVLAGPGGLVGVGSGFGSTAAWLVALLAMAVLLVVAWLIARRRRGRDGAGRSVAGLQERDRRGGESL